METLIISTAQAGLKILQFLERQTDNQIPRSALMRVIRKGIVKVDGKRVQPFAKLEEGSEIKIPSFDINKKIEIELNNKLQIEIIDNQQDFILINKQAGIPVHGGSGWDISLVSLIRKFGDKTYRPVPVHRLDKDTSGLLLFAKTHQFLQKMHLIWSSNVTKKYLTWVDGILDEQLHIEEKIEKKVVNGKEKMIVGSGKISSLIAKPIFKGDAKTLLEIQLGTGKTHQIRVLLADKGLPIIGDNKYGNIAHTNLLLHAYQLSWLEHDYTCLPQWGKKFDVSKFFKQ